MSYAKVWGNSEQQYSGHICKYDKATQSCSSLTGTGWNEAFFSPTYNTPLKSMNLSEDGFIYALRYNNNTYKHEIARIDSETGEIMLFYAYDNDISEMLLVGDKLIFTSGDSLWGYGGIYSLDTNTKIVNAISDTAIDAPDSRGYANYTVIGVYGDYLYYAYNDCEAVYESTEEPKMRLERYSFSSKEKELIPLVDEFGKDYCESFDAYNLICMGDSFFTITEDETVLFHLDTGLVECSNQNNELTDLSLMNYKEKLFMDESLYLINKSLENGVNIDCLFDDLSNFKNFYAINAVFMRGSSLYHMELCSLGKADNHILMATEDRMIFLNANGTETVLDFEN